MRYLAIFIISIFIFPTQGKASIFGEETAVLAQILQNAVQQLAQLQSILGTGRDTLGLMREINSGINDSLGLINSIGTDRNPGIYGDLSKLQDVLAKIQQVYGTVTPSPDFQVQHDMDEGVAEAITLNNSLYQYTKDIDALGEEIKVYSHAVSPGGAQKLTAQTLGVMLHVMNQSLRAQATGLKIQAQALARENRYDKEETKHRLEVANTLNDAMQSEQADFTLPRF
jgi:hypothetical protein